MFVYLIALIDAFAYLAAVPVCTAFYLNTEGGLRFGVGVSAFSPDAARDRATHDLKLVQLRAPSPGVKPLRLWRTVRNLRVEAFSLQGRLSLGDAAATATACGALTALACALGTVAGESQIDIAPDFDSAELGAALQGMIRARAGQIILAAARGELNTARERIARWTDTRLKASWPPPWKTSAT